MAKKKTARKIRKDPPPVSDAKPSPPSKQAPSADVSPYNIEVTGNGVTIERRPVRVRYGIAAKPFQIHLDLGSIPPEAIREALDKYECQTKNKEAG